MCVDSTYSNDGGVGDGANVVNDGASTSGENCGVADGNNVVHDFDDAFDEEFDEIMLNIDIDHEIVSIA